MAKININTKGKVGELEWAKWLRDHGFPNARRGVQYQGGQDSPDVVGGIPWTHCEVKRTERLKLHEALRQADADCGKDEVMYVAHRRNHGQWCITIYANELRRFAECVLSDG